MSFLFRCEICHEVLTADAQMLGTHLPCPACDVPLWLPDTRTDETAADSSSPPVDREAREPDIRFGNHDKAGDAEMDMTPMVDVTFLLLIFFMVTAAFTMQKSFELPTPKDDTPSQQARSMQDIEDDPSFVVVRIDEFNTFHVLASSWDEEKEAPSEQELIVKLREARQSGRGGIVPSSLLVMAHGDALHEKVVTAIDAGAEVGMDDVKLTTFEGDE
ncbi:MAG: biopolymer transporter ExbD [Pirellulaceae bacterium]|nr:biopolymer transporter ExbD [Planctomycetales bacterium]